MSVKAKFMRGISSHKHFKLDALGLLFFEEKLAKII